MTVGSGEFPPGVAEVPQKNPLDAVPGLEASLHTRCNVFTESKPQLTQEQIITAMSADKSVSDAVLSYVGYGGEGFNLDPDAANSLRDGLMMDLINKLREERDTLKSSSASS